MIRHATPADLEQILRIERAAETAPHWTAEDYRSILERRAAPVERLCLLAEEGGFLVGSVLGPEAELESVAVLPEARRQGIGRSLCAALLAWARERGADTIHLEVRAASHGARRLYAELGFAPVGLRPGYYHDPADDAVLMRCDLRALPPAV